LKTAAKPLKMETWLLLTAIGGPPASYPIVPSPTPYDFPFSHNTFVTDGRTDRRHILPETLQLFIRYSEDDFNFRPVAY